MAVLPLNCWDDVRYLKAIVGAKVYCDTHGHHSNLQVTKSELDDLLGDSVAGAAMQSSRHTTGAIDFAKWKLMGVDIHLVQEPVASTIRYQYRLLLLVAPWIDDLANEMEKKYGNP